MQINGWGMISDFQDELPEVATSLPSLFCSSWKVVFWQLRPEPSDIAVLRA
jgi:hypothetical protein